MKIRKHKKILIWCLVIIVFSIGAYNVDSKLVSLNKRPIFVIPTAVAKDGGTTIYLGIGYQVIGWKKLDERQIDGKVVLGRMTGYEISTIFNAQNINKGPKKELEFVPNK